MEKGKKPTFQRMTVAQFRARAPERSIQSASCDLLALCGIPFSVTDAALIFDDNRKARGRAVTIDGWCDVSACLPGGRFLGIETKSREGKLRPSQIACHKILRASGALVIVPRSVEEVAQVLVDAGVQHAALIQLLINRGAKMTP